MKLKESLSQEQMAIYSSSAAPKSQLKKFANRSLKAKSGSTALAYFANYFQLDLRLI
ncbi:hypothetical protein [Nodosilinea nodulosa]|uniref:hypothetical protein n=1 Tax=Nodosilinea nodulosa TaxID=416001 RepID=UPI0003127B8B|nr:hypothetical protein [Nodosilinea nodulosa]